MLMMGDLYPIYDGWTLYWLLMVIMDIFSGYSIYQSYDIYDGLSILLGGDLTILKNMKVNGKDDIPYIMKWKIKNVWNHQPE